MADAIPYVDVDNFEAQVLNADKPTLVDFTATWCVPCKSLAPKLDTLAQEKAGKLNVVKVDVDASRALAVKYNIRNVPTLLMFNKGQVVGQTTGNVPPSKLQEMASNVGA